MSLPSVPPLSLIQERLPLIFPQGLEHRNYVIRMSAAHSIWVMFYAGAIDGAGRWVRPSQITDMTDEQALRGSLDDREEWYIRSLSSKKVRPTNTWYANNSREQVRDESIRTGLIPFGAVVEKPGVPTTSSKPRYALAKDMAVLFILEHSQDELTALIATWRKAHLSPGALARMQLVLHGAGATSDGVMVTFPNGETRAMKSGKSSEITKAVIERYAKIFLKAPAVLWVSESGKKVLARDDDLARRIGLHIDPSRALPDIILVDLEGTEEGVLVVFVEVVASDGPVHRLRKDALAKIAIDAGFTPEHLRFLTAYQDRSDKVFKQTISDLAWDTAAWFASEPHNLIELRSYEPGSTE